MSTTLRKGVCWLVPALALVLTACAGADAASEHPWLQLPAAAGHTIVESTGVSGGQVVIALDSATTPETAIQLGHEILRQAPPQVTLNVRLYNDEATARNWRTVPADWTQEHLWVLVRSSAEGGAEVRWVGPEDGDVRR